MSPKNHNSKRPASSTVRSSKRSTKRVKHSPRKGGTVILSTDYKGTTIQIVQGDITAFPTHAIVNAADTRLRGGEDVNSDIHKAAGPALQESLDEFYPDGGKPGGAYTTAVFKVKTAKWIIHAIGPDYRKVKTAVERKKKSEQLGSAYRSCFEEAVKKSARNIAFPRFVALFLWVPHHRVNRFMLSSTFLKKLLLIF